MNKTRHRWQKVSLPYSGQMLASCSGKTVTICSRCRLLRCGQAHDCSTYSVHSQQTCERVPKPMATPEKPADLKHPRRAATIRLMGKLQAYLAAQHPYQSCGKPVCNGDDFRHQCGVHLIYRQRGFADLLLD